MTIRGGSALSAHGISLYAGNGGTGTLTNTGTLLIEGSKEADADAIGILASGAGSVAEIHNYGGTISILGKKGSGIDVGASADGRVSIVNHSGTIDIRAGQEDGSYGIHDLVTTSVAAQQGATGEIENDGTLNITGGSGDNAFGMATVGWNYEGGAVQVQSVVRNSGVMTVKAGTGAGAHGIAWAFAGNTSGGIFNDSGGTISLLGTESASAIGGLSYTDTTANFSNSGTLNMNKYAIGSLSDGVQATPFVNTATGTVNAEAEAIFQAGETSSTHEEKPVTVYSASTKTTAEETIDSFVTTITTSGAWKLKDDWAQHSQWDEGGTLTITDIAEGTYDAQTIRDAFTEQFGTGTTLKFTGTGGGAGSTETTDPNFTMTHVNQLLAESKADVGSVITSESLDAEGSAFKLGTGGQLDHDFGFMGITNTTGISVADGNTLTLTGEQAAMTIALRANQNERATYVITDKETVLTNGQLKLGIAELTATQGVLADVTADSSSAVVAEHGVFEISAVKGGGHVVVEGGFRAHAGRIVRNHDDECQGDDSQR